MKIIFKVLSFPLFASILFSCSQHEENQNSVIGKVYTDKKEIPAFNNYEKVGGALIDYIEGQPLKGKYGIAHMLHQNQNILIFEKIIEEPNNSEHKIEILDTLNIDDLKKEQYITYCHCKQDTIYDAEIIALVTSDKESEFGNKVIKAWRADTKEEKIIPIKSAGITCNDEGYDEESDD